MNNNLKSLALTSPHPPLHEFYRHPGEREHFVRDLFDGTAPWYDWAIAFLSFGSGNWYRRQVLTRAGLERGDRVLDIATGTGVIARAAAHIIGEGHSVIGLDPSIGMLIAGREKAKFPNVQARSERLPFRDQTFDFVTIGFALRHFADLEAVFNECARVLRPNGKIVILEITAPQSRIARGLLGAYMGGFVPAAAALVTRRARVGKMLRYYWATTRDCVRPNVILGALQGAGFREPRRNVDIGIFSEYSAQMSSRA